MVRSMQDWPWDSYRATFGQSDLPAFLTVDWVLLQFDPDRASAVRAYCRFVHQGKEVDVWEELRAGMFLVNRCIHEAAEAPACEEAC